MRKHRTATLIVLLALGLSLAAMPSAAQSTGKATLRSLTVDWYESSNAGVKLQYRDFENQAHILYLPKAFEKKYFRFVEAPKNYSNMSGLPMLLVHMKDKDIVYVDIYTEYLRKKARMANFTQEDLDNFKAAEQLGKVELAFE
jgi:hypothetical protein